MRIAHVVLAHRLPEQAGRLARALAHPDDEVLVHVDARVDVAPFAAAVGDAARLIPRSACRWGGFGMVEAALTGIREALASAGGPPDHVCLLSGQDYPIVSRAAMAARLAEAGGAVFMEAYAMPRPAFVDGGGLDRLERWYLRPSRAWSLPNRIVPWWPRRTLPAGLSPHGGGQFWCLPVDVARWVVEEVDARPELERFFRRSFVPDETFFQTLIMSGPHGPRVAGDDLHFVDFAPVDGVKHPRVLTAEDLPALAASGDLYARKFEDPAVLDLVDELRTTRTASPGVSAPARTARTA